MKIKCTLLIAIVSVVLFSCGGKNNDKDISGNMNQNSEDDCLCSEMNLETTNADGEIVENLKGIKKNDSKDLYTGFCFEKDQNDSIIQKTEIKSGWVVRKISRQKINGKYITTGDYTFENSEIKNGWEIVIGDNYGSTPGYCYVTLYEEIKNSSPYNKWEIQLESKDTHSVYIEGLLLLSKPKCVPLAFDSNWDYQLGDLSSEEYFKTLDCLKGELPKFNYWKLN